MMIRTTMTRNNLKANTFQIEVEKKREQQEAEEKDRQEMYKEVAERMEKMFGQDNIKKEWFEDVV
jgi:hypothetical protein